SQNAREWWRHGHVACPFTVGAATVREGPLSQWVKRRSIRLLSLWASMPRLKSLNLSKHNVPRSARFASQRPMPGTSPAFVFRGDTSAEKPTCPTRPLRLQQGPGRSSPNWREFLVCIAVLRAQKLGPQNRLVQTE